MTVIHTNDSHFDLVVSRNSRLGHSLLIGEQNLLHENDEFLRRNEGNKNLKQEITPLKSEIKGEKSYSVSIKDTDDLIEERVLLNGKQSGFAREGQPNNSRTLLPHVNTCKWYQLDLQKL